MNVKGIKSTTPGEIRFRNTTTQGHRDEFTLGTLIYTRIGGHALLTVLQAESTGEKPVPPPKDAPQSSPA